MSKKTLGIILAAGRSSRLYPATLAATKQVLPVYDKPLIYYPLSTLMLAGVRDFVIISNPDEKSIFQNLFKDCENTLGINIRYGVQNSPKGIADAFNVAFETLEGKIRDYHRFALILGDNIFYGSGMSELLYTAAQDNKAIIFATKVHDPERFGVVEIKGNVIASIEEKPVEPRSNLAVTGLYFYNEDVFDRVYNLKPSDRGELEITDINKQYLSENKLAAAKLPRGAVWFDTGTPDSLLDASNFIKTLQKNQDLLIGSPHEIAYNNGWVDSLDEIAILCNKTAYGKYLGSIR